MAAKESLFNQNNADLPVGVSYKTHLLKRRIIFELAYGGELTIADLATAINVSNPTSSKLVGELIAEGYLRDMGKITTPGGRRPSTFGLVSSAGYFMGIDAADGHLNIGVIDLNKNHTAIRKNIPFELSDSEECLNALVEQIKRFIDQSPVKTSQYLGIGMIIRGRVDSANGRSYNIFNFENRHLAQVMTEKMGIHTIIENDTRAMAYAEWESGTGETAKDALFVNIGRGVGVGIMIGGKLYYGKSGFSGEFGHIPFFDNQKICHCGKKGCLETEASGAALEETFIDSLNKGASSILSHKENIGFNDIIDAASHDDVLSIELITSIGEKLGRGIGVLINLFNPELVVVGGALARAGDYLMLPIRTALNKYSLSLVNRDSSLRISSLGETAGVLGAALLARCRILELK